MIKKLFSRVIEIYEEWRESSVLVSRNDLAVQVINEFKVFESYLRKKDYLEKFEEIPIHLGFAHVYDNNLEASVKLKYRAVKAIQQLIEEGETFEMYQGLVFLGIRKELLKHFDKKFSLKFFSKRRGMNPLIKRCVECGKYRVGDQWFVDRPVGKYDEVRTVCIECMKGVK